METRNLSRMTAILFLTAALCPAAPAFGHHSFAAYESAQTLTLTGTVEAFEWANPHVAIHVLARENAGDERVEWDVETSGLSILKRFGWTRDSIKRGDRVIVVLNPMRDGSHGGRLHTVTLLDTGQVLKTKLSNS